MLLIVAVLVGLAAVPVTGGRLSALGTVALRANALLAVAMIVQVAVITVVPDGSPGVHAALHLATYGLGAAWVVVNRRLAYMWLAALGGAMNLPSMSTPVTWKPASANAMARAGLHATAGRFVNSGVQAHPRLLPLGDVFAVPRSLPLANVYSAGDIVLAAGVVCLITAVCHSARVPGRVPPSPRGVTEGSVLWDGNSSGPRWSVRLLPAAPSPSTFRRRAPIRCARTSVARPRGV